MKEHPVDKFFAQKLGNLVVEPSAEAWNKIEHNLETKRKPWGLYFSVAASFTVILAVLSYVLLKPIDKPVEDHYFEQIQQQNQARENQRPKTTQPAGTVPGSENSIPVMAQQGQEQTINKHSNINRPVLAMADYTGDETEFQETALWPIDRVKLEKAHPAKKKYGMSIANASKYLEKESEKEDEKYGNELKSYSAKQWSHIKSREKLDALPLPNINLPKLKFEKNSRAKIVE